MDAGAKRKRDYESGADVIGAALSRMEGAAAGGAPVTAARGPPFVAAASFGGARPGYFFGRGAQGVGYYADARGGGSAAAAMPPPPPRSAAQAMPPPPPRAPAVPSGAQLLEAAERDASGIEVEELDVRAVRRAVLGLERRLNENLAARVKYADEPEKFIDSEVDLHEEVKRLGSLAAAPELYPELVRLGAAPSLLALLSHDNADIAAEGALLLRELTDADAAAESDAALAGAAALAEALSAGADAEEPEACAGLAALVSALGRFDESQPEEAAAVHSLLNVFENLVEISPVLRDRLLAPAAGLLAWLLQRVTAPGARVDANRVYAAELLAILLAGGDAAARRLGEAGGVDALLRAVAPFKGGKKAKESRPKEGADAEMESEFVENCFDALCSAVLLDENKAMFVEAEGVELMLLVIRGKGPAKGAALRCLDFAVTRCASAAARLVAAGGLGAVFAAFSGRSAAAARARRGADAPDEEEARAVSLLASMLQLLPRGAERDRVAAKFVEDGFAKVDRLIELWFKYTARVAAAEQEWDANAAADNEDEEDEEDEDEERYNARMDAGLMTLQQVGLIFAQLWCVRHPGLCGRAAHALQLGGGAMAAVRAVLREHAAALGDAEGEEARQALQLKILRLADTLYLPGEAHSRGPSDDEAEEGDAGAEAAPLEEQAGPPEGRQQQPQEGLTEEMED